MPDEAPPEGEMLESQAIDQGARDAEIAELQDKLNSVTKSYEDLRPHADRAFSAQKERKERIERAEAERQRKEAEALARKEEAMRKLDELKKSPVGKATGIVATKEGIGAIGGGAIGAALGGSLGVAGKIVGIGVALNGGIVLAGIGAVVGFLGVKAFKKNKTEKAEHQKIKDYGEKINEETRNKNK